MIPVRRCRKSHRILTFIRVSSQGMNFSDFACFVKKESVNLKGVLMLTLFYMQHRYLSIKYFCLNLSAAFKHLAIKRNQIFVILRSKTTQGLARPHGNKRMVRKPLNNPAPGFGCQPFRGRGYCVSIYLTISFAAETRAATLSAASALLAPLAMM